MKSKFCPSHAFVKDTGLVLVLVLLLAAYWTAKPFFLPASIGTLLVAMTIPAAFKPLAVIWYYFSMGLGKITNRIIFTFIFVGVLIPVGLIRKCLGFDPMKRKVWKSGVTSVFTERRHTFIADDLNKPY